MYLLDTSTLSELVKKIPNKNLITRMKQVSSDAFYTASICVMELRYGALKRRNRSDLWPNIQQHILSKLQILSFSSEDAMNAAELLYHLQSLGHPIGIEDTMIGAIALSHGLTLVTANTKHFSRIPGLKVENWFL